MTGIVDLQSNHSVDQTVTRVEQILRDKGVTLFAVVDHGGEAAKVGLDMRPTKLVIFGSARAGTPVMVAAPSAAIDLPLKILVWEDAAGKNVGLLQLARISPATARDPRRAHAEHRGFGRNRERCYLNRSVARTISSAMRSPAEWPESPTTTSSERGQARCSSHAFCSGD